MPIFASTCYAIGLDSVNCGIIAGVSGGAVSATVTRSIADEGKFISKHLGNPVFEDLILECPMNLNKVFFDWIAAAWTGTPVPKDATITLGDVNLNAIGARKFVQCLIKEVTIPTLDTGSRAAAHLRVKVCPTRIEDLKPGGKIDAGSSRSKSVLTAGGFKLDIEGLSDACAWVTRIDGFTVAQNFVTASEDGAASEVPSGPIDFPNLKLTLPENHAQPFKDWFQHMVIEGKRAGEKNGSLKLVAANRQTLLGTVKLNKMGIVRIAHDDAAPDRGQRRLTVELYCDQMEFVPA
jgi:hypothetical protein